MKIFEGRDDQGSLIYFEIANTLLSRRAASLLVSRLPGVVTLRKPSMFSLFGADEVFCVFQLEGGQFELWEPFGDNSRFHVAANPLEPCVALDRLRLAFQEHLAISAFMRWLLLLVFLGAVAILSPRVSRAEGLAQCQGMTANRMFQPTTFSGG